MHLILRKSVNARAGFTLTELMAVVIIIALLAGLATGSYKKAVERSRFADGLSAASTIMSAVERYYADHMNATDARRPKKDRLDISFANVKTCSAEADYCYKTKYFETTIYNGYTQAVRRKGSSTGDYALRVYSSLFGNNTRHEPDCRAHNKMGFDLCVSMGYSSCSPATSSSCSVTSPCVCSR